jgi:tRNA(Ile)-lysidine synthase
VHNRSGSSIGPYVSIHAAVRDEAALTGPDGVALFAGLMAGLGPFERAPRLAVAVSGGADSLALALLTSGWARARGGSVLGLVVDHDLRSASGREARLAVARLGARGIAARLLTLTDLHPGTALAERARAARYRALQAACAEAGILHLLVGHHRADQAETVLMRQQACSGPDGLAGMAALVDKPSFRLLRPLLDVPPVWLRDLLRSVGQEWTEDPSNADPAALRARLRAQQCDPDGTAPPTAALADAAAVHAADRAQREARIAEILAARVRLYPQGFAVLSPGPLPAAALAALLRMIGGASFSPSPASVRVLAAAPRPATLGGVRLLAAGRLGPGLLVVREAAAMAPAVAARADALWDGRFRLLAGANLAPGMTLGALGADAPAMRLHATWPAVVLATLPALRVADALVAVPHLCYASTFACKPPALVFAPAHAAAPAPFLGAGRVSLADRGAGLAWRGR